MRTKGIMSALLSFAFAAQVGAQGFDQELPALADRIAKGLVSGGVKTVAAVDFTNLQGQPTELGRYIAERLALEIVAAGGVSVADRATIKSILAEHQLTEEGLVNPANAKKLGEFAGVQAILTGTLSRTGNSWEALVKAVSTGSATIVAAGRITFPVTSENQQSGNLRVYATAPGSSSSDPGAPATSSYADAGVIAEKEIGSLRIVLKSVLPMKAAGNSSERTGSSSNVIRCTFELINRETQQTVYVAMNAALAFANASYAGNRGTALGESLRSSLLDERGARWGLPTANVTGVGVVGVGQTGPHTSATPTDIATLLERRDATGTDKVVFNQSGDAVQFVYGSPVALAPGQRLVVTMDFVRDESGAGASAPETVQLTGELVIGTEGRNPRKRYSLHNIMFDRITIK